MRIVCTGGRGFLGTWLCRELEEHGHETVVVDHKDGPEFDLRFPDRLDGFLEGADYCVHLAAQVGRLFGEENIAHTITSNTIMTAHIAQSCARMGVPIAYASTSEVYGDQGEVFCADHLPLPDSLGIHNAYGLTKRHGEEFILLYAREGHLMLRFSMPYGPGHPPGFGRAALTNFVWNARQGIPITVHRDSERSWTWVGDTVRAVRMLLEARVTGAWNIGRDDNVTTMERVAEMACDLVGADRSLIEIVDPPARQTVVKRLSMLKIRNLGWNPEVELDEGMRMTLAWLDKWEENEAAA